jgi:type I site-specific restriction endonuclease
MWYILNENTDYFACMLQIKFPEPDFKIRQSDDQAQIFDPIRQKWIMLQDEEWERQNMIAWLVKVQGVTQSFISVEKTLPLGNTALRFDLLIYDQSHQPWMIIECKSPEIKLDEKVLMQALSYNSIVPVPFILITNGNETHLANKKAEPPVWCSAFPKFGE